MPLDISDLMRDPRLQALPIAVRIELRKILPDFFTNGVVQCRRHGEARYGWRLRYRATDPDGLRRHCSLSLGRDESANLAAQWLQDLKRASMAEREQQRTAEKVRHDEAQQRTEQENRLRRVFMEHAAGSTKSKRAAWQQLDKRILVKGLSREALETITIAQAQQVRRPARGRPRKSWWSTKPAMGNVRAVQDDPRAGPASSVPVVTSTGSTAPSSC